MMHVVDLYPVKLNKDVLLKRMYGNKEDFRIIIGERVAAATAASVCDNKEKCQAYAI